MHRPQRDIDGLVLGHQAHLLAHRHPRRTLHHDPVFGPVDMALQRQGGPGGDGDALDLKPLPHGEAFEPAPGTEITGKNLGLPGLAGLERLHRAFDILRTVAGHHQHRIGHGDGDDALQSDAHQFHRAAILPPFGAQERVMAVDGGHMARGRHPRRIRDTAAQDRFPIAQIGPFPPERHHRQPVGFFHHRVIDGNVAHPGPCLGIEPQKAQIAARLPHRGLDRGHKIGGMAGKGRKDIGRAKEENPRVPQMIPRGEQFRRPRRIGLFDKSRKRHRRATAIGGGRQPQIAIAGFGPVRRDAESHEPALTQQVHPGPHRLPEGRRIGDDVIGGGDQQHGLGVGCRHMQGGGQHGGGGVAPHRFDQDRTGVDADRGQLLGHDEAQVVMRHDDGWREIRTRKPPRRGLQQAVLPGQPRELLGIGFARQRPEPGACPSAEKNRSDAHPAPPLSNRVGLTLGYRPVTGYSAPLGRAKP